MLARRIKLDNMHKFYSPWHGEQIQKSSHHYWVFTVCQLQCWALIWKWLYRLLLPKSSKKFWERLIPNLSWFSFIKGTVEALGLIGYNIVGTSWDMSGYLGTGTHRPLIPCMAWWILSILGPWFFYPRKESIEDNEFSGPIHFFL